MAPPNDRRRRELAREQARAAAASERRDRARRNQRIAAAAIGVVLVLALLGGYLGTSRSSTAPTSTTTSSISDGPSTTVSPKSGVTPPPAAPGAALTGATPCPAADGSSPRTTSFAQAPPTCIDPAHFYRAVIHTTKGDLTVQLNPSRTPSTVNDFVVLSLYHFYDGQPVTAVTPRMSFTVGMSFSAATTMFDIPNEIPKAGQIFGPGTIAMVGTNGVGSASRGQFLLATFEIAPNIDDSATSFGTMLDGFDTLTAIDALGSQSTQPTAVVTITSIDITQSGAIPR